MYYKESSLPRVSDFDRNGKISYEAILQILENVGSHHADTVNNDISEELKKGIAWILVDWRVSILKQIHINEVVNIKTWVRNSQKPSSVFRDFIVMNDKEETVIKAEAKYCLFDLTSSKLIKISEETIEPYQPENECVFDEDTPYINEINEFDDKSEVPVRRSDIDFYGHLHNTRFLGLAADFMPENPDFRISEIHIVYKQPILETDALSIGYKKSSNCINAVILKNNQPAAMVVFS